MADWSLLPDDVLGDIALKLDTVEDFICFGVVCRSWNLVSETVKRSWSPNIPWLLLAEGKDENKEKPFVLRKLFSPTKNRCYELELLEAFGARCWGSSYGWIVTIDLNLEIHLFNPLTKARVRLPSHSTMPNQIEDDDDDEDLIARAEWYRNNFVHRAILLKLYGDDGFLVMAIHYTYALAFARPEDREWTLVVTPSVHHVCDITSWNGRVIIMHADGALAYCDIVTRENNRVVNVNVTDFMPPPADILVELRRRIYSLYLFESFGHLLMVLRYKKTEIPDENDPDLPDEVFFYRTFNFEVYRLNADKKEWEKVDDLGDLALFVGNHVSMSVRASDASNCRRNCIYFTDDEFEFLGAPKEHGGLMGVFDMGTSGFEPIWEGENIRSRYCPPLWFMPRLS